MSIGAFCRVGLLVAAGAVAAACAAGGHNSGSSVDQAAINAAVDAPDRMPDDGKRDAARKPKEMLAFFGVAPGMKVLDVFTGGGWYAELEARVVGSAGEVWAQNPPEYLKRFGDKDIVARLANNRLPNVRRIDRSIGAMELPKEYFDGVVVNDVFHDIFWLTKDDRGAVHVDGVVRQLFEATRKGGFVAIVDHSAPAGTGDTFARDISGQHRIDEALVKQLMLAAGFKLDRESQALRNPADDRTKPFFAPEMKGINTDKFALRFVRPR
jgi:predicted methyltransferase